MLQSIKQIYGDKLGASDGEIGHVNDFYFDDKHWVIRYLVADTGSWMPGRSVLISPHSLECLPKGGKILPVNLTRKQIEDSPPTESHKPVSRQYEEEYYQYYGWPYYWQGDAMWGMSGFPILLERSKPFSGEPSTKDGTMHESADSHLRSTQAMDGYSIHARDEPIGHVYDFLVDDKTWAIGRLVVKTGHWYSGKHVLISPRDVERISWDESAVYVSLTKELILQAPAYDGAAAP